MTRAEQESDGPDVKADVAFAAGNSTVDSASAGEDVTELNDGALEQMSGGKPTHPGLEPGGAWHFYPRPEVFTIGAISPPNP